MMLAVIYCKSLLFTVTGFYIFNVKFYHILIFCWHFFQDSNNIYLFLISLKYLFIFGYPMLKNRKIIYKNFNKKNPQSVFEIVTDLITEKLDSDEILVKISKAMIHPCDLGCASGYVNGIILPSGAGFEGLGIIKDVGINFKKELYIGQKVHVCATHVLDRWKLWKGVWCDYMILKKNEIILIPQDINDERAIQLFVNVMTPLAMVKEMNLKKGDILLQTAANSVVGRVIIQLSKIYGFKTINIVRNKLAAINLCKKYNISEVYVYSNNNHKKLFNSLSNKYNNVIIKYVIDSVSGNLGLMCWKLLSQNGVFYSYGALSGKHSLDINVVNDLCRNNKTLKGWSIQETWLRTKSNKEKLKIINEIWELFQKGKLNLPTLGKTFELEQFQEALIESQKPQKKGKITLRMS